MASQNQNWDLVKKCSGETRFVQFINALISKSRYHQHHIRNGLSPITDWEKVSSRPSTARLQFTGKINRTTLSKIEAQPLKTVADDEFKDFASSKKMFRRRRSEIAKLPEIYLYGKPGEYTVLKVLI